jgi:hypothetical protein
MWQKLLPSHIYEKLNTSVTVVLLLDGKTESSYGLCDVLMDKVVHIEDTGNK